MLYTVYIGNIIFNSDLALIECQVCNIIWGKFGLRLAKYRNLLSLGETERWRKEWGSNYTQILERLISCRGCRGRIALAYLLSPAKTGHSL